MSDYSKREILQSGVSKTGAQISLVHRSAGFEIAGAGVRIVGEAFGYLYVMRDGTKGGQWFETLGEAKAKFNLHKA